jgi:phage shock protein C
MYCSQCGRQIETDSRFCAGCGAAFEQPASVPRRVLVRPREGRLIAGVCAAFANCYGWDISVVRVVAVILLFLSGGSATLAYVACWIFIPEAQYALPERSTTGTAA